MGIHVIRKGLDIPILGEPEQVISDAQGVTCVAVLGADFNGMTPSMRVVVGDKVKRGQPLFEDKKTPGVIHTSPAAGNVLSVNYSDNDVLTSVVVELSERERNGPPANAEHQAFSSFAGKPIPALSRDDVRALLLESGLWTAFRTRPFSRTPAPDAKPDAIFITAIDTSPLAAKPEFIVAQNAEAFGTGLAVIAKLREGFIFLCVAENSPIKAGPYSGVNVEQFSGPHPAGLVGAHIHFLRPVDQSKTAWHIGYQDVIRIGKLFETGQLNIEQIVAIGGPAAKSPRLVRTRLGASIAELLAGETGPGEVRVISGSVLSGRVAAGDVFGFLGRFHQQVSCVREDRNRGFLGWLTPGANKFSILNIFASSLQRQRKKFAFTTSAHGSTRPMVPIGVYERVMPMDLLPTFLLRALVDGDIDRAERLGCLELDEEDLGLCTFVCPGKCDYAPYLRKALTQIEERR